MYFCHYDIVAKNWSRMTTAITSGIYGKTAFSAFPGKRVFPESGKTLVYYFVSERFRVMFTSEVAFSPFRAFSLPVIK